MMSYQRRLLCLRNFFPRLPSPLALCITHRICHQSLFSDSNDCTLIHTIKTYQATLHIAQAHIPAYDSSAFACGYIPTVNCSIQNKGMDFGNAIQSGAECNRFMPHCGAHTSQSGAFTVTQQPSRWHAWASALTFGLALNELNQPSLGKELPCRKNRDCGYRA